MRHVGFAIALSACWTGTVPVEQTPASRPAPRDAPKLTIKLRRTACLGTCPTFLVVIHGDGRIEWDGRENVAAIGFRKRQIQPRAIEQIDRLLLKVRFFDRNESGELPQEPNCTTSGTTTSCSFESSIAICSDTSRSIITVARDGTSHTVTNDHCGERTPLDDLEDLIDQVAQLDAWIGG